MGEPEISFAEFQKGPRWPDTYACDILRQVPDKLEVPGLGKIEVKLSRSEASRIISFFAKSLGMDRKYVATCLAYKYWQEYHSDH